MRKPEILAPAGNLEKLKTAIDYGADAVYLGGSKLNLRAFADNFTNKEMAEGVKYAHDRGRKVYVTMNVYPHNSDLIGIEDYLRELYKLNVDAILVADPSILVIAKEVVPNLEIHLSTQANNVNWRSAKFWHDLGVKRIVLARELSLKEIREIREKLPESCDLEAFVHGAMCVSYSGRCLLSNYMIGRDSNRGACAQPCRFNYYLVEEKRPGEYYQIKEDEHGSYIMNSKDLCMVDHLPDLIDAGVDSLKIEGRMKAALYVAVTARTYRKALDDYKKDPAVYEANLDWYKEEIAKCTIRSFSTGFYYGKPDESSQIYDNNTYQQSYIYLGICGDVREDGTFFLEQKNKFSVGETIEILKPNGENVETKVLEIIDEFGRTQESAPHAKQPLYVKLDVVPNKYEILRKRAES